MKAVSDIARYVDADELIRLIEIDALCNRPYSKRDAIGCVKAINAADVVPRSEVANGIITDLQWMWKMSSLKDRIYGMDVYVISRRDYQTIITELKKKYTEG